MFFVYFYNFFVNFASMGTCVLIQYDKFPRSCFDTIRPNNLGDRLINRKSRLKSRQLFFS